MPIKHALWTVGANPTPLRTSQLISEQLLDDMIEKNLSILSENWILIGRQEITPFGGRTDLLAIDPNGNLVLIELKRHKTHREIVAQAIDYTVDLTNQKAKLDQLKPQKKTLMQQLLTGKVRVSV